MLARRRPVIGLIAGMLAGGAVFAQPAGKVARIGLLGNLNAKLNAKSVDALREGLRELGWAEGRNLTIEYRWADGDLSRHVRLAEELVGQAVDVIVTAGPQAVRAAMRATRTIPIVVAIMPDPVALGFAESLPRPGGNVTGLANFFEELTPKQVQIFKEALPKAVRLAMLSDAEMAPLVQSAAEDAARSLGMDAKVYLVTDAAGIDAAIDDARREHADGVQVLPSPFFNRYRGRIAERTARIGLPTISEAREYVLDGGLMSYGPSFPRMYYRAASYVDRILKGSRPGDLPIERPTRFELVLNLKTARVLGLQIPRTLLLRADEIVE